MLESPCGRESACETAKVVAAPRRRASPEPSGPDPDPREGQSGCGLLRKTLVAALHANFIRYPIPEFRIRRDWGCAKHSEPPGD